MSIWIRPADITKLLDHILEESNWAHLIDPEHISATEFSSGGYTVLALAGVLYDDRLTQPYCASSDGDKDCKLATNFSNVDYSTSSDSNHDARIKSVFAVDPRREFCHHE